MGKKPATPLQGQELVGVVEDAAPSTEIAVSNPARLLEMAVTNGAGIETLERLMALQERFDANEARKAFVRDMAAFKANPPEIVKAKLVDFTTQKGRTTYMHAELGAMCVALTTGLASHGFSHGWKVSQDGTRITVTCTITHRMGHSESVSLSGSPDDSGGKNAIQSVASTVTYLERYTLVASTGIVPISMPDDDGRGGFDADGNPWGSKPGKPAKAAKAGKKGAGGEHDETGPMSEEQLAFAQRRHKEAYDRHIESIKYIKDRLDAGDFRPAIVEWMAIGETDRRALWLAHTKGGCLSTAQHALIRENQTRVLQAIKAESETTTEE